MTYHKATFIKHSKTAPGKQTMEKSTKQSSTVTSKYKSSTRWGFYHLEGSRDAIDSSDSALSIVNIHIITLIRAQGVGEGRGLSRFVPNPILFFWSRYVKINISCCSHAVAKNNLTLWNANSVKLIMTIFLFYQVSVFTIIKSCQRILHITYQESNRICCFYNWQM